LKDNTKELLDRLRELTNDMDVPEYRKDSPRWLARNLGIRNKEHPNYSKAKELISYLIKTGGV